MCFSSVKNAEDSSTKLQFLNCRSFLGHKGPAGAGLPKGFHEARPNVPLGTGGGTKNEWKMLLHLGNHKYGERKGHNELPSAILNNV